MTGTILFLILFGILSIGLVQFQTAEAQTSPFISGRAYNDLNGNGIDDGEDGVSGVLICIGDNISEGEEFVETDFAEFILFQYAYAGEGSFFPEGPCTRTESDGSYFLDFLDPTTHNVYASDAPLGMVATTPLFQGVDLSSSDATGVNFGFVDAGGPPPEVQISPLNDFDYNGLPTIYWQNPTTTFDKTVDGSVQGSLDHCGPNPASAIQLEIGPFSEPGDPQIPIEIVQMSLVSSSPEVWRASVGPLFPNHGTAQLKFVVTCPANPSIPEIQMGGSIYIDPSGFVTNACNGLPIAGAEVSLFKAETFGFPPDFFPASFFFPQVNIPPVDTLITDPFGHYGWDVTPGSYRVDVDATQQGFGTSSLFVTIISTPVLDANFELVPENGCPVGGKLVPIDNTALLLASVQTNLSWLVPILVSVVGLGFVITRRYL
jgi:hypothetical protein